MIAAVLGALAIGGAAWHYSDLIDDGAFKVRKEAPPLDLVVRDVSEGIITLAPQKRASRDWQRDGTFGLVWQSAEGYARVGEILDLQVDRVVRELTPVLGAPRPGERVRLDLFAYPTEQREAGPHLAGVQLRHVTFDALSREPHAWFAPGSSDKWLIFVHGKGSVPAEVSRLLPAVSQSGLPMLSVHYRNDEAAPAGARRRYGYGFDEWRDVAAALDYAQSQGARRFVLAGNSMGGAIVMALLEQPRYAALVSGVILDSPVLDMAATIDFHGRRRNLPSPLTWGAKQVASWRFDIDWQRLDYLSRAGRLNVPFLLFHGSSDSTVPVSTSDAFAARRSDIVTYRRVPGAGHVRAWNAGPVAYESALREFLGRVAP